MEPQNLNTCARCGAGGDVSDPFCAGCGALRPSLLFPGSVAVDVMEVPSQRQRSEVAQFLKTWFPSIDLLAAEQALKQDSTRLISGIDEDSARRIIEALKALQVVAQPAAPRSWASRFLNAGLVVSVLALLAAPWMNVLVALLLVLVAVAAPVARALLKGDAPSPLISAPRFEVNGEDWARIANDYGRVVAHLAPEDAKALESIVRSTFDLRTRLARESLASAAAGGTTGEFFGRLREVLLSAIAIGERTLSGGAEGRTDASHELGSLSALMVESLAWFATLEREGVKKTPQIAQELSEIRSRIDGIVHEVRSITPGMERERELG